MLYKRIHENEGFIVVRIKLTANIATPAFNSHEILIYCVCYAFSSCSMRYFWMINKKIIVVVINYNTDEVDSKI